MTSWRPRRRPLRGDGTRAGPYGRQGVGPAVVRAAPPPIDTETLAVFQTPLPRRPTTLRSHAHGVFRSAERGEGEIQKVSIRATNIFRKEDGQWKMIGHHVDLLPQMAK